MPTRSDKTVEEAPKIFTRNGCVTLTVQDNKRDTSFKKAVHSEGSNFWIAPDGWHVEGTFQAAKHEGHPWRQLILNKMSPGQSKRFGRLWELSREELLAWDRRKWYVMSELISLKLYYPEFCRWLAATGTMKIVEFNWWHDNYWGDCQCIKCFRKGANNHLGQILMKQREQLMGGDDSNSKRIREMYGLEAVYEAASA